MLDDLRTTRNALTNLHFGAYMYYRVGDYRIICDILDGALCVIETSNLSN